MKCVSGLKTAVSFYVSKGRSLFEGKTSLSGWNSHVRTQRRFTTESNSTGSVHVNQVGISIDQFVI
jgi:hypothetical protein